MRLHAIEAGDGEECVVLLHGMMGSAESWWRVVPRLVAAGRRVLSLDLPGHGLSPRDAALSFDGAVRAVVDTVHDRAGEGPLLAVGHSYGGLLLAAAAPLLHPRLTVHVDTPFRFAGGQDRVALTAAYERDRSERTPERLRATRPHYSDTDAVVEGRAAERFDPATSASVQAGHGAAHDPLPGSIVIRADPSDYVSDDEARRLAGLGVDVRSIPGAAHTVWYSHFDGFIASLPELF